MSKKSHNPSERVQKTKQPVAAAKVPDGDLFSRLETFLEKRANRIFWIIFGLSAMLVALLFEMKIGLANDDALYIEAGNNFSKDFFGYFYTGNAPLYPMFLSLVITVFGSNLVVMKLFSSIFFLVSLYLMFRVFRGRMPYAVLFASLFITATNYAFMVHAALTYTECFFAMVQVIFLWVCLLLIDKRDAGVPFSQMWKSWLGVGAVILLMYMSRNVASAAGLAVLAFFVVTFDRKNPLPSGRNIALTIAAAGIFILLWELVKHGIWGQNVNQFTNQGAMMLRKDIFNPNDPNNTAETFSGYLARFWGNVEVYFGGRLWEILGLRKENSKPSTGLALLALLLMQPGFVFAFVRKNRAVMLSFLYFMALSCATFFAIHTYWAQSRLVMIYLPFIFFTIFYGFYELFRTKALGGFKFFWVVFVLIFALPNLFLSLGKIPQNLKTLPRNLAGDEFYGYTPDWVNFFRASRWCARELPEDSYVASRRAPMSFVYGDLKEFYPIYSVTSNDADTVLNIFKTNKVTHVLLAELRVNPSRYIPNRYINTMHRVVMPIVLKYPQALQLVHSEGTSEKAEVYEIHYELAQPSMAVPPPAGAVPVEGNAPAPAGNVSATDPNKK